MKYQTILLNYSHEIVKNLQSDLIHFLNATKLYIYCYSLSQIPVQIIVATYVLHSRVAISFFKWSNSTRD